jgi:CheY-like chemotaxis protein
VSFQYESVGLIRVRGCCLFTWRQREFGHGPRIVKVDTHHCPACIDALRSLEPPVALEVRHLGLAEESGARRIMVVDDDPEIRQSFASVLGDVGCEVSTFGDGAEALLYLRSGAPLPNLILLDLIMPVLDGPAFREEQKKDPLLATIPVVVVTAAGVAARLDDSRVLRKPVDLEVLLSVVAAGSAPARLR